MAQGVGNTQREKEGVGVGQPCTYMMWICAWRDDSLVDILDDSDYISGVMRDDEKTKRGPRGNACERGVEKKKGTYKEQTTH